MKIEQIDIDKIKPYKLNAKKHPQSQIEGIAESIKRFGFSQPIVLDKKNEIIIGHGRLEAAKIAGLKEVPCLTLSDLTPKEVRALRLIDNRIAETGWDQEMLKIEFEDLEFEFEPFNVDFDNELPDPDEVEGQTDPDAVPEQADASQIQKGDIFKLGDNFLMCGDSTSDQDVAALLGDVIPVLMVTDPPYGVNYDPSWREGHDLGVGKRSKGKVQNDDLIDWSAAYKLFPGDVAYIWHAGKFTHIVAQNIQGCGFELISQIIWAKQHFALSRGDYHWQHEPCWYAVRKGKPHAWGGARDQSTLWQIKNNNAFGNSDAEKTWGHGTQKPVECMKRPILNNTKEGQWIYDPFLGSGTTLIAAYQTKRRCRGMEIDPTYCAVIIKRFEEFSGEKAQKIG